MTVTKIVERENGNSSAIGNDDAWTQDDSDVHFEPFTLPDGSKPLQFFMLQVLTEETNRYAHQTIASKPDPRWYDSISSSASKHCLKLSFIGLPIPPLVL